MRLWKSDYQMFRLLSKIIWWVYIVLLFVIPFGFLLPITYRKFNSTIKVFGIGISSILLIELFQLFTKLGSFDIDDIILNMAGIICGYLMIFLWNRIFIEKR